MAVSEIESVLRFLRENGFTEAENALREDMKERNKLGSVDLEKFLFPVLPPVRIPTGLWSPEIERGEYGYRLRSDGGSSSDDDEFVSINSYLSEVTSSSEFVNPYGRRASSRVDSEASSDRLSQFDTARTYQDWNLFYRQEVDQDGVEILFPAIKQSDLFSCPTQDKFVTNSETDNQLKNLPDVLDQSRKEFLDKSCLLNLTGKRENGDKGIDAEDCFCLYKDNEIEEEICDRDPLNFDYDCLKERDIQKIGTDVAKIEDSPADGAQEEDVADEQLMYDANKEEFEVFDLRIIHRKNRTGFEENKDLPIVQNAVIGGRYYVTEYLGSAAFSKVVQAHDLHNGIDVCLKIIKNDKDFFDQSLDEIKLLKLVNKKDPADEHHILRLYDYFYYQEHLFIVCELLRANLYEFQKFTQESGGEPYFSLVRLQAITRQCLDALVFLHGLGIIHCDLKPENILIKSYKKCLIKIIDLGSSCFRTDNLCLYVQSRSYRAPEVILGLPYDEKIDLWSLGCILAELYSGEVLFPNEAVVVILGRIIGMLGPIDLEMLDKGEETYKYFTKEFDLYQVNEETEDLDYIIPEESSLEDHLQESDVVFVDFIRSLLEINPERRPTAREALGHPWLSCLY